MIFILAFAYNSVYSLAFMKSLYYQIMLDGLKLTHFRLGQLYSIYGILSMISYLFGALFLSRFSFRKLVPFSLLIIGLLTFSLSFLPAYPIMIGIFGTAGFLLGAVFYPAHLQILRHIGSPVCQGTVFSLFYAFNGILGICFAALGFKISRLSVCSSGSVSLLFCFFALLNIIAALSCGIILQKLPADDTSHHSIELKNVLQLVNNRMLWLVILIVFTNYIGFSSLNYILLYFEAGYSVNSRFMNVLVIARTYLIAILAAPIAGKITDQFHSSARLMKYSFLLNAIALTTMISLMDTHAVLAVAIILLSCLFVNMGKSMALITIDEARIPPHLYGICISFISFCAYSPDAFFYSVSGYLLDHYADYGYIIIFLIVIATSLIGFWASAKLKKSCSSRNF